MNIPSSVLGRTLKKFSPGRLRNAIRVLKSGRPRCLKIVRAAVKNQRGIEIGGPSAVFRRVFNLPVYDCVGQLDNCDFSQNTEWADHAESYQFHNAKPAGRSYFCEGSDLSSITDNSYDFLLSSHNLEHFANPFRALREWKRIVKPGGYLIIVLPHYLHTFDRYRVPTTLEHMLQDDKDDVGEDDLTHVDEIMQSQGPEKRDQSDEELHALLLNNFQHRMIHHHVFDEHNSRALLEAAGLRVLALETQPPFHIYLLTQLPAE